MKPVETGGEKEMESLRYSKDAISTN